MAGERGRERPRKSWAEDIVMTNDIDSIKLKLLLKGGTAVGKTTFMGSADDLFVIDAESGLLTLFREEIPSYPLARKAKGKYFDRTMAILDSIENNEDMGFVNFANIKAIGLDSASKLNELLLMDIMKKAGVTKASFDEWGELNYQIAQIMNRLIQMDKHFICTTGEATKVDDNGRVTHTLNMRGSYKDFIEHEFDFVLWMQKEDSPRGGSTYFTTGQSMQGRNGKMRGIELPKKMENPTFNYVYDFIKAEIEKEKVVETA